MSRIFSVLGERNKKKYAYSIFPEVEIKIYLQPRSFLYGPEISTTIPDCHLLLSQWYLKCNLFKAEPTLNVAL